jgi:hypothetical protein
MKSRTTFNHVTPNVRISNVNLGDGCKRAFRTKDDLDSHYKYTQRRKRVSNGCDESFALPHEIEDDGAQMGDVDDDCVQFVQEGNAYGLDEQAPDMRKDLAYNSGDRISASGMGFFHFHVETSLIQVD